MEDGVKFIFKTLFRVPIIIYASFAVFNIFAFCFAYFSMLGASYVVQQAALEDNYLSAKNVETIGNYIRMLDYSSVFVEEANIIIGDAASVNNSTAYVTSDGKYGVAYGYTNANTSSNTINTSSAIKTKVMGTTKYTASGTKSNALKKRQYGNTVTVGVTYRFRTIWPFDYRRSTYTQKTGVGIGGYSDTAAKTNMASRQARGYTSSQDANLSSLTLARNCINIVYTVPGLKYYPDLKQG